MALQTLLFAQILSQIWSQKYCPKIWFATAISENVVEYFFGLFCLSKPVIMKLGEKIQVTDSEAHIWKVCYLWTWQCHLGGQVDCKVWMSDKDGSWQGGVLAAGRVLLLRRAFAMGAHELNRYSNRCARSWLLSSNMFKLTVKYY